MKRRSTYLLTLFAAAAMPVMAFAAGPMGAMPAFQFTSDIVLAAQKGSGGTSLGYTCDGLQCTCQGDDDCNDLFGSGKCGDIASCDNDTGICKCLIFKKTPPKKIRPVSPGTVPLLKTQ
jgi:hypothetical protein